MAFIQVFSSMFAWPCILDINNIDDQLDATMTVLLTVSISSTCFGQLFSHLQERYNVFCSLRYNAPELSAGSLDAGTCLFGRCEGCCSSNIPHTGNMSKSPHPGYRPTTTWVHYTSKCKTQSSASEDGQIIARNMLSWFKLLIKLSFLHLAGRRYYT
jgi:hypothetical protein